jgi:hypothetical protein
LDLHLKVWNVTPYERELQEDLALVRQHGTVSAAARVTGRSRLTLQRHIMQARKKWPGCLPEPVPGRNGPWAGERNEKPFYLESPPPSELPTLDELKARRRSEFQRVHAAKESRRLIDVKIAIDGPIGIAHFGDPHIDDPGTNLPLLERHVGIVNRTEGLFGANVGDQQNLWVGRLARLYGEQSTSAAESWMLAEWLVRSVQWLYLLAGNHDLWAGAGDPIKWMMRVQPGVHEAHGARLNLCFPNGRKVRINARHDFLGHSMWNTAHGPAKAVQMGWRDHILTCGHRHTSGYNPIKDPATGLISHAIRVASYKWHDRYADEKGLPDQNFSENVVTVIDPQASDERSLVTVLLNVEEAAEFLIFKRRKHARGKRAA